ncbi:BatA domain-containing protein, partial [Planktotalea sp.]|uniref:BatA domain-containing protein n=1 Tax=Planktotalea sp. TaxID=2029877 RepID=UPI003299854A
MIGALGFTAPWLLLGLLVLPILWIILRAVPPAPIKRIFPGVTLLLGLKDEEQVSDRTPWWLLLLRMLAVAALIIGFAGPVLNPRDQDVGTGPLLVVMDASWASAPDWPARIDMLERTLGDAARANRTAALLNLSRPEPITFQSATNIQSTLAGLQPSAWQPSQTAEEIEAFLPDTSFDTIWVSDELAQENRSDIAAIFERRGTMRVLRSDNETIALAPSRFEGGVTILEARRAIAGPARTENIEVHGKDPSGAARILANIDINFDTGATSTIAELSLPAELRARITHFAISGIRSAGAQTLSDDTLRRREVALIAGREDREGLELLSPLHYLRQALQPNAELLEGSLTDTLPAAPDVVILADVAALAPAEDVALQECVEAGGLLVRFAGPRLAASDVSRSIEDALMPVRLRAGGRTVGGAMSWGTPKELAPFTEDSPFFGLSLADDVSIRSQVMAQPDPTLAARVIASLSDGTPLVTRKPFGEGQVVLFHVTANAEWSSLPLSGLFVSMLDRLAISSLAGAPSADDLAGTTWQPLRVLDGFGRISDAGALNGVSGDLLLSDPLSATLQPGLYEGKSRSIARNVISADTQLETATWPSGTDIHLIQPQPETPLAGILLGLALVLLTLDILASLAMSGR